MLDINAFQYFEFHKFSNLSTALPVSWHMCIVHWDIGFLNILLFNELETSAPFLAPCLLLLIIVAGEQGSK